MKVEFKISPKHIKIFTDIKEKGYYKPAYSDQEPALKTLEKNGLVEWRGDFKGVTLTKLGEEFSTHFIKY